MSRRCITLLFAVALSGAAALQQADTKVANPKPPEVPAVQEPTQLPPEEDGEAKTEQQYSFNPVKSKRDVAVGVEYFKKGNFKAAADRFTTATRWNEGNPEAWLRLGEAEEKRGNHKAARVAYQRFLELSPDAKTAAEVRKRLEKLKA